MRISLVPAALSVCVLLFASPASAVPFTFAPNAASPPLGGSAFTADTIFYTNTVFSVVQPDTTFVSHRILNITGFGLNGNVVSPPGFGSAYGLYVDDTDLGNSTPSSLSFSGGSIRLVADPGNRNGAVTSTVSGVGFANTGATGTADDILLASGVELSGVAGFNPATGVRTTHFLDSYAAAPGEAGFFLAPGPSGLLDFVNTTDPGLLINSPGPNGTTIQTINRAFGVAQVVPEPSPSLIFGLGLLSLFALRRPRVRVS